MRVVVAIGVVLMACSSVVSAQRQPPPPPNPLSLITAFQCTFPRHAATEWPAGQPETSLGADRQFSFRITNINTRRNSARIVGSGGSVDATAMLGETGLNVVEQTGIGNFILTTIFRAGGKDRVFVAAHSRHLGDLQTVPSVSQHFGTCEPLAPEGGQSNSR